MEAVMDTPTRKPGRPRKGQEKLGCTKIRQLIKDGYRSPTEIAQIVGTTPENVTQHISRYIKDVDGLLDYKKNRADIFADAQRRVLDAVSEEDIKKASLRDKAIWVGTMVDKERLERGQSTQNIASLTAIAERLERRDHKM